MRVSFQKSETWFNLAVDQTTLEIVVNPGGLFLVDFDCVKENLQGSKRVFSSILP